VEQYIQTYLYRDVKRLFPGLDEVRFRRFLEMLGGLSGRVINHADVARALGVSQPTARDYFDIAHGTFVWRSVPAYTKDSLKRVVKHPRGYLRDTGLRLYDEHLIGPPFTRLLFALNGAAALPVSAFRRTRCANRKTGIRLASGGNRFGCPPDFARMTG
jgi:hypothetical protein